VIHSRSSSSISSRSTDVWPRPASPSIISSSSF
jgi:hypothetical protein